MHCAYFTSLAERSELPPPDPAPAAPDEPPAQAATPSATAATAAASSAVLLPRHDALGGLIPAVGRVLLIMSTLVSFAVWMLQRDSFYKRDGHSTVRDPVTGL